MVEITIEERYPNNNLITIVEKCKISSSDMSHASQNENKCQNCSGSCENSACSKNSNYMNNDNENKDNPENKNANNNNNTNNLNTISNTIINNNSDAIKILSKEREISQIVEERPSTIITITERVKRYNGIPTEIKVIHYSRSREFNYPQNLKNSSCKNLGDFMKKQKTIIETHVYDHMWFKEIQGKDNAVLDFIDKYAFMMREMYCGHICEKKEECKIAERYIPEGETIMEIDPVQSCSNLVKILHAQRGILQNHLDKHKWFAGIADEKAAVVDFLKKYGFIVKDMYCGQICDKRKTCDTINAYITKVTSE